MRILVGWDDASEADLISMYLSVDNDVVTQTGEDDYLDYVKRDDLTWDVILLAINLPDADSGFEIFQTVRQMQAETPIVGACNSQEVFQLVRFMSNGMRSYVIRDSGGDYVFLLQSILQSARGNARCRGAISRPVGRRCTRTFAEGG